MKRYLEMTNLPFKVGQVLTVTGVPNRDGDRFSINVGHSVDDIALHIDVRFNYDNSSKQVLINSCRSGTWDKNHKIPEEFPFKYDEKFKVSITFTKEKFLINLSDESKIDFPNSHGYEKYNFIFMANEVKVHAIEVI
ncbi:beta-galactoside-binding lectin-like isoform X2 [Hypomesus transpacificus]|uniref:beta-galactoside-binding lectin-like isoform X2 n=1 Tax=Hypomesus transpacificus TaxID=137520 RepID=UPI001F074EA8|nr:beta-galactoside-binding lectin-like isoform X2 [Hypomesus transpacificus]